MADLFVKFRILWRVFILQGLWDWKRHIWDKDLDGPACCNGRECACGGATLREIYDPPIDAQQQEKG